MRHTVCDAAVHSICVCMSPLSLQHHCTLEQLSGLAHPCRCTMGSTDDEKAWRALGEVLRESRQQLTENGACGQSVLHGSACFILVCSLCCCNLIIVFQECPHSMRHTPHMSSCQPMWNLWCRVPILHSAFPFSCRLDRCRPCRTGGSWLHDCGHAAGCDS